MVALSSFTYCEFRMELPTILLFRWWKITINFHACIWMRNSRESHLIWMRWGIRFAHRQRQNEKCRTSMWRWKWRSIAEWKFSHDIERFRDRQWSHFHFISCFIRLFTIPLLTSRWKIESGNINLDFQFSRFEVWEAGNAYVHWAATV